jgi:hypothetical protein
MRRQFEAELEAEFPQFSRIWVQYSHVGKYRMCITLFPVGGFEYKMIFGDINQLTYDNVKNILVKHLESTK